MSKLVNIGFGNSVNADRVIAVASPVAAPVKRLVSCARENGSLIDATQGRKTKGVIIMDQNSVVLSALQPETILKRFNDPGAFAGEEKNEVEDE
ncbi:MAG: DUF370 domain-containing protein [Eubacterium sp.]|nr:DUF370 domain-containing protein [Eubacterium sp.]